MGEIGADISKEFPKPWTDEVVRAADIIRPIRDEIKARVEALPAQLDVLVG